MNIDLKSLASLSLDGAKTAFSTIAGSMFIGLLITIAIILVLGKLGAFRRSMSSTWNVLAKFWIPYLVIAGLVVSFKIGVIRAAHSALTSLSTSTVDVIYERTLGAYLSTEQDKRAFLLSLQRGAQSTQDLGKALSQAIKQRMHSTPDSAQNIGSQAATYLADLAIDHYQEDITSAVMYGLYAQGGDYLKLHNGAHMDYGTFKAGVDELMRMDVGVMRKGIKDNLTGFAAGLIHTQYRNFITAALLLASVLLCLPLADWGIHTLVSRNAANGQALDQQAPPH